MLDFEKDVLTPQQIDQTLDVCLRIFEGLDDFAIKELFSGYEKDVDTIFSIVYDEAQKALFGLPSKVSQNSLFYLDNLYEGVEEGLRVMSLNYFLISVIPDFIISTHHLEWGNLVQLYRRLGVVAPRDHGKSFYFSKGLPLWRLYRYRKGGNPYLHPNENKRHEEGMMITAEHSLAKDFLTSISKEIEGNPILSKKLYEGADAWGATDIRCGNGARLFVKGFYGTLRGRHPGWMILDDILEDRQIYSLEAREAVEEIFYSVVMNALSPFGHIVVVGTPFHQQDLYSRLKKDKSFRVVEYPAILPNGQVLWRERHSLESLMEKKENQGNVIFTREILCKPVASDSTIFPWEYLQTSLEGMSDITMVDRKEDFALKIDTCCVAVDLAISANVGADFTVITIFGTTKENPNRYYLLNMYRFKGATYDKQIREIKKTYFNFRPDILVVESNGFQESFIQMLETEAKIPVFRHRTTADKKLETGLPSMAVMFERSQIKIPQKTTEDRDKGDILLGEFNSIMYEKGKLESTSGKDDCAMSSYLNLKIGFEKIRTGFTFDFV